MAKKRTASSAHEIGRLVHLAEERYRLFRLIAKLILNWGGGIALGYVTIALPVKWSAGQWTHLEVIYRAILEGGWTLKFSLGTNAALVLLWWLQRRAYNKAIEREHRRVPELERTIDSRRSTSTPKALDVHTGGSSHDRS